MLKVNVGKFGEILNGRPDKMSYEEYVLNAKMNLEKLASRKARGVIEGEGDNR